MSLPRELGFDECVRRLRAGVVGRVALATPDGPQIIPVNYSIVDEAIIVATSPYSALATYGAQGLVAFEIDHVDYERHAGWSVLVRGRADIITDPQEVQRLRRVWAPRPWAEGARNLHVRIPWSEVSGRQVGEETGTPVQRIVRA